MHSATRWKLIPSFTFDALCWLYTLMKEEHYNHQGEIFEMFLTRMVSSKMKPGGLKQLYTSFMQNNQDYTHP